MTFIIIHCYNILTMNKNSSLNFLLVILFIMRVIYLNAQLEINETIKISDDLELTRITENSYIHISYLITSNGRRVPCNGLIYVNRNEAFIIDTPVNDEITLDLIHWLKNNLSVNVTGVIVNHWHVDCMGGLNQIHK